MSLLTEVGRDIMGHSFEMSISEKNKKVLTIIKQLKQSGMNVSEKFCEYIMDAYETEEMQKRYHEHMKENRKNTKTLEAWGVESLE